MTRGRAHDIIDNWKASRGEGPLAQARGVAAPRVLSKGQRGQFGKGGVRMRWVCPSCGGPHHRVECPAEQEKAA